MAISGEIRWGTAGFWCWWWIMFAITLEKYGVGPWRCNFLPSTPSLVAVVRRHEVVEFLEIGREMLSGGSNSGWLESEK